MIIIFSLILMERNTADIDNDLIVLSVDLEAPKISLPTLIGLW